MIIKPADGRYTSGFRPPHRRKHHGVDIAKSGVIPIKAAAGGVVTQSYRSSSYGECIMIKHEIHGETWETVYAHMRAGSREVATGQRVSRGQKIGVMGNTGRSTGQHLHFELHRGRWNIDKTNAVDPRFYIGGLRKGAKGKAVEALQEALLGKGYALPRYGADGSYGNETYKAVRQFQRDAGIKVDGIAGEQTFAALSIQEGIKLPTGIIRMGARSERVREMQEAFAALYFYPDKGAKNNGIDGIFGEKTRDAVRRFQKVYLPHEVDGVYGPNTRAALLRELKKRGLI